MGATPFNLPNFSDTYEEKIGVLTQLMSGKTLDYVLREGKVLRFVFTNGQSIRMGVSTQGDIIALGVDVNIILTGVSSFGQAGM